MKIFIPCAGIGSRLEFLTKNLNKSLVSIGDRPAIAHIIDKFSNEHTFVIALGYQGDLLRQFLTLAYPERKFEFVVVDNFNGEGSGLGLTILSCKDLLQEPFLFIPTDSLFEESQEFLINNKDCIFFSDIFDDEFQYRKIEINNGKLNKLLDRTTRGLSYTGICHINSYKQFWNSIDNSPEFISIGETFALNVMAQQIEVACKKITWNDMGNLKSLDAVKRTHKSQFNILEKENESIWFLGNKVIKYHHDKNFISNRVKRFQILDKYVPDLISYSDNMYCYEFVSGNTLSVNFDVKTMIDLLKFLNEFWTQDIPTPDSDFEKKCLKFYKEKTIKRIEAYTNISNNDYHIINGVDVGSVHSLLSKIDWDYISSGVPSNFHGDLHFENIIKSNDSFYLLDWRQDFEGDVNVGDIYYDFAKLLHGMIVAHDVIKRGEYQVKYIDSSSVYFDFYIKNINILAQDAFFSFLKENSFDVRKVKILTALIFLNIAPLHHDPYNHMLYYLGKLQLYSALMEK